MTGSMDDLAVAYQVDANHGGETGMEDMSRRIIDQDCNSSSSSSIGNDSDDGDRQGDAQSCYRSDHNNLKISNGSLDHAIRALEEALPIRRGISRFYEGKSKSFTCLAANMWSSSSSSSIAKPDNALNRKRRNLLASTLLSPMNKTRAFRLSDINTGRITKKPKTPALLHFGSKREDTITNPPSLSSMRSFSMLNLHPCKKGEMGGSPGPGTALGTHHPTPQEV